MSEDAHKRPPGFFRATIKEQARLVAIRPPAPPRLLFRVGRWWTATVLRESAPQLAVAGLVVLAILLLRGAAEVRIGVIALAIVALLVLWEIRHVREWVFEKIVFKRPFADSEEIYREASPAFRVHPDAPPFLVIHGDRDTLVPVGDARDFVEKLRTVSSERVAYVELPGAEHAFDLWPSERSARISEGIGRFLTAVAKERGKAPPEVGAASSASSA